MKVSSQNASLSDLINFSHHVSQLTSQVSNIVNFNFKQQASGQNELIEDKNQLIETLEGELALTKRDLDQARAHFHSSSGAQIEDNHTLNSQLNKALTTLDLMEQQKLDLENEND